MPAKAHLAILKQGVSVWNEWRAAHPQTRPELSHIHLHGLDLINADLAGADLSNADLRGTDLSGAKLMGANLEGANFFRTVLDGADLSGANLSGAQFLTCLQLTAAHHWRSAYRDLSHACGAPIAASGGES